MIEKKNIDRLFQEKFKDFESVPSEQVWENIEEALKEKKKKRVIPIWFRLSGVAAILLIGLMIAGKLDFGANPSPAANPDNNVVTNENRPPASTNTTGDTTSVNSEKPNNPNANTIKNNDAINTSVATQDKGKSKTNPKIDKTNTFETDNNPVAEKPRTGINAENKANKSKINHTTNQNSEQQTQIALSPKQINNKGDENLRDRNTNAVSNDRRVLSQNNQIAGTPKASQEERTGDSKNNIIPGKQGTNKNTTQQIAATEDKSSKSDPQNTVTDDNKIPAESIVDKNTAIAENAEIKNDSAVVAAVEPNALEELLKEEEKKVTITEPKLNRWQLTSNVAPIYFSSASNGSPLDSRFESTKKSYKTSVSYGVGVAYSVNKKFSVRSGVNSVALEYSTTDVVFFQTQNARQIENVTANVPGSLIEVDANPGELSMTSRADKRFDGSLNQKIGYIEVPVEMSYKVIDKKFGVEVIGGFSTLFLNQNEVALEGSGLDMTIGEANNLSDLHFSTNIGVGLKYNFLKSLQLKVEPILKYQINTFSNDAGNFKPYFFGVYTGLNYRF